MLDDEPHVQIGELARRTATSPELLRAWERRYGLLHPTRTRGGFRLYAPDDERRVGRMQEHLARGVSAAEAARLVLSEEAPAPLRPGRGLDRAAAELLEALERYDEPTAQAFFDQLLATFGQATVVTGIVLPVLHRIGEGWRIGCTTVAQEHFASAVLRGRLLGLARGWDRGVGRRALLACPPGEQHDLGLLAFGLLLRREGWRIVFLGADTPLETLGEAIRESRPAVLVLSTVDPRRLRDITGPLVQTAAETSLRLGGAGADGELDPALELLRLPTDPAEAAVALTREHRR